MSIELPTISEMGINILIILNTYVLFEVAFSTLVIMKSINSEKHHRCCSWGSIKSSQDLVLYAETMHHLIYPQ